MLLNSIRKAIGWIGECSFPTLSCSMGYCLKSKTRPKLSIRGHMLSIHDHMLSIRACIAPQDIREGDPYGGALPCHRFPRGAMLWFDFEAAQQQLTLAEKIFRDDFFLDKHHHVGTSSIPWPSSVYDPSHIAFAEIIYGAPVLPQRVYGTSRISCVFPDENFPLWSLLQGYNFTRPISMRSSLFGKRFLHDSQRSLNCLAKNTVCSQLWHPTPHFPLVPGEILHPKDLL